VFNNSLPVSSLFCKISLLSLPHCLPTCIHWPFCSPTFCSLCAIPFSMNLLFSVHLCCCTPLISLLKHYFTLATTTNHSQQQQQPFLFSVPCTYSLCAPCACNVRNPLHVEFSACSSWKLFSFSICSAHVSIITGCHAENFLCITSSPDSSFSLLQLHAPTHIQLSIASMNSLCSTG
jgi:hypothetical protein